MPALALAVMGIAVPDSLNPTLIVAQIYLALGARPVWRTLAFAIGAFVVTLAGGLLIALGVGDLILALVPKPKPMVKWIIVTAIGVALICGSPVLWWRRKSVAPGKSDSRDARTASSAGGALVMGGGIAGFELLTAFPYFAAIGLVVGASVSAPSKLILLLLYNMVYIGPLIAIVIACAVLGDDGRQRLAPIGDWIESNWPVVVAPLAAAIGTALTAYGLIKLV